VASRVYKQATPLGFSDLLDSSSPITAEHRQMHFLQLQETVAK